MKFDDMTMAGVLSVWFAAIFTVFFVLIIIYPIPETNRDIVLTGAGVLYGIINMIAGYHWGSSQGSADKSVTINKALTDVTSLENPTKETSK